MVLYGATLHIYEVSRSIKFYLFLFELPVCIYVFYMLWLSEFVMWVFVLLCLVFIYMFWLSEFVMWVYGLVYTCFMYSYVFYMLWLSEFVMWVFGLVFICMFHVFMFFTCCDCLSLWCESLFYVPTLGLHLDVVSGL